MAQKLAGKAQGVDAGRAHGSQPEDACEALRNRAVQAGGNNHALYAHA